MKNELAELNIASVRAEPAMIPIIVKGNQEKSGESLCFTTTIENVNESGIAAAIPELRCRAIGRAVGRFVVDGGAYLGRTIDQYNNMLPAGLISGEEFSWPSNW